MTDTKQRIHINWILILCLLAVMAAAVLVRLPASRLSGMPEEKRAVYMAEEGLPYLTDPDSYYHARIVENDLTYGSLSADRREDGVLWDTQSRFPEGRSAEYQKGIVYAAEAVSAVIRPFGGTVYAAAYWLPSVMAALAAAAAFILGYRISGTAAGLTAGILVSCATAFTARVLPGRFDTDMFSAVMDVLLILTITEALRAQTIRKRVAAAAGFALTAVLYSLCWSVYAMMFSALTVAGGAVYLIVRTFIPENSSIRKRGGARSDGWRTVFRRRTDVQAWLLCLGLMTGFLLPVNGFSFFRQFVRRIFWAGSMTESGTLPNLLASVTELNRPELFPSDPAGWFVAYIPGKTLTVLNGVGGAAAGILCIGGLVILFLSMFRAAAQKTGFQEENSSKPADDSMDHAGVSSDNQGYTQAQVRRCSLLYICILGTWLAGSMYASMQGVRFIQHLSVPVGLLAGTCVGYAAYGIMLIRKCPRILKVIGVLLICGAAAAVPVSGSAEICSQNRPSVSDALADGMKWIRDNAEDENAVIASWWDLCYYYEYASGHPAFWDGGSQEGVRAILIAKALTSRDPVLSERILQMMACYGNRPAVKMAELLGEKTAFDALWEALLLQRDETERLLKGIYGIPEQEAASLAEMIHPEQKKEVYLVISGDMLYKLGWIEYYADWSFDGKGKRPAATVYSSMPDGSENMKSETEKARAFFEDRAKETIWRLFFVADGGDVFVPEFESSDGVSQIQVWKVL